MACRLCEHTSRSPLNSGGGSARMATVVGVFDAYDQAERCVWEMRARGFTDNEISILAKGGHQGEGGGSDEGGGDMDLTAENIADGTAWGGAIGAAGGLLAGAGALAIPGMGPLLAVGPLAATLSGAMVGAVTGGLIDLGVPEERGRDYEEEVKQGSVLAVVEADQSRAEEAARL